MSVLDREELEQSPLADLHAIASELGIDGFRRLRKAELVDRIVVARGGEPAPVPTAAATEADAGSDADATVDAPAEPEAEPEARGDGESSDDDGERRPRRRRRGRRRGGSDDDGAGETPAEAPARAEQPADDAPGKADADAEGDDDGRGEPDHVEGTVVVRDSGSGLVTANDEDKREVYLSAAQIRRCEIVEGDVVAGPVRRPRRSERYPTLVRVETINGVPADEASAGTRYDDLPAEFPSERLALGVDDQTVATLEWLTPFGKGSRVTIAGPARSGKSEIVRRLAHALAAQEGLDVAIVLTGVRPEEIAEWRAGELAPAAATSFAASGDAHARAIEAAVDRGRKVAARGGDAVVLIDALDAAPDAAARRALAAARKLVDSGSLTVIAAAAAPLGGETTVIALHPGLVAQRRFPPVDVAASGTMRAERLVGDAGVDAIARALTEQQGG